MKKIARVKTKFLGTWIVGKVPRLEEQSQSIPNSDLYDRSTAESPKAAQDTIFIQKSAVPGVP